VQRRSAQISIIQSGFDILAREETNLSDAQPAPLDEEIVAQWEQFITDTLPIFDIPGAVVGVVRGGEPVYAQGFGYADPAAQTPMTPQTHMLIGSTSKSLTTMMMATLVDDGLMEWDTPAQELYPDFAVKDPALSETITMRNLVCACTGVPRRDFEVLFNASELSAADIVASLRDFEFFTDFGEAFQYSNQMVATGGYIAGHGAQPDAPSLEAAYVQALQERVLDPLGMEHTTISFDEVEQAGDYATPHGYTFLAEYAPIPLAIERTLTPIAPAGGYWSTLEDMAKYMVAQLSTGVAPDSTRVVSEENLLVTRVPQVKITAESSYGLGWMVGDYKGLTMIDHSGNTLGFTSDFAFFPTADLGIIILANAQGANNFTASARLRLIELLYGLESEVEPGIAFVADQLERQRAELAGQIGTLDAAAAEPFLGRFANPALGGLVLTLEEGKLYADFGEFRSELLPKLGNAGEPDGYITADAPLAGLPLRLELTEAGRPSVVFGAGVTEYAFLPE
jgi:CubicO group peptidase (beta-lactamase class C family)